MRRLFPVLIPLALVFACSGCSLVNQLLNLAIPVGMAKLYFSCLPEGTMIDTPAGPVAIEELEAGDTVIGYSGATVLVVQKHAYLEDVGTEFFKVGFAGGASVDLCGMHRVGGVRAQDLVVGDVLGKNRVATITTYHGVGRSFDLLTEDSGYRVGGVPVNSMIQEMAAATRRDLRDAS